METSPLKIKTAVPVEVQEVLDAMTEENWLKRMAFNREEGRACFVGRAALVHRERCAEEWFLDLQRRCRSAYGLHSAGVNDSSSSLSDFKSKIIALYETEG